MRRRILRIALFLFLFLLAGWYYVAAHPLVFNESFWQHAHCITGAGMELMNYADVHGGAYPTHVDGYGDALLLMNEDVYPCLTGPGYDETPFLEAKRTGANLDEALCGRVYVQGLTTKSPRDIAILFDKLPTPGGDHCHGPARMWAALGREVWFVGGTREFIAESDWPAFTQNQITLLIQVGFSPVDAQALFAATP